MSQDEEYLSQEKYNELVAELNELSTNKRKEIAEALEQAKSLGDLRENSEYQEARSAQAALEERIAYLEKALREHLGPRAAATRPNQPHVEFATLDSSGFVSSTQLPPSLAVYY